MSEEEHSHEWTRRQNVTSKGHAMPPYETCACGAARPASETDRAMSGDVERVAADYRVVRVTQVQRALDAAREAGAAEVRARVEVVADWLAAQGADFHDMADEYTEGARDAYDAAESRLRAALADPDTATPGTESTLSRPNPHSGDSQDPRDDERRSE
jgi:uncharacterized protein (DUF433 family)